MPSEDLKRTTSYNRLSRATFFYHNYLLFLVTIVVVEFTDINQDRFCWIDVDEIKINHMGINIIFFLKMA